MCREENHEPATDLRTLPARTNPVQPNDMPNHLPANCQNPSQRSEREVVIMLRRLFQSACELFQALILVQLLAAAAVVVSALLYFVVMTCFRAVQSAWVHLFSRPFP